MEFVVVRDNCTFWKSNLFSIITVQLKGAFIGTNSLLTFFINLVSSVCQYGHIFLMNASCMNFYFIFRHLFYSFT